MKPCGYKVVLLYMIAREGVILKVGVGDYPVTVSNEVTSDAVGVRFLLFGRSYGKAVTDLSVLSTASSLFCFLLFLLLVHLSNV